MIDKIIGKGIAAIVQAANERDMFAKKDATYEPNVLINKHLEPYIETVVEIAFLHPMMQTILLKYENGQSTTEDFFLDVAASCIMNKE